MYFNRTLLRKKLTSARAVNAANSVRSSACGRRISPQVSDAPTLLGDLWRQEFLRHNPRAIADRPRSAVDRDRGARHGIHVATDPERVAERFAFELRRELRR